MKIALLTGGGDAPGLNAVIYAITRISLRKFPMCELIGYKFGYRGMYKNNFLRLTLENTSGILNKGGTILSSSNKDNLFDYLVEDESGNKIRCDVSDIAIENLKRENVDVLIVMGGDGTLTSARDFSRKGVNVIGVPKTIDNDLDSTDTTFGFDTAVNIVTENLERLHTTAESHHRIIIVEVMGRNAGWIALYAGIAGSADVILIPEIEYDINNIIEKISERDSQDKNFSIIIITEGAHEKNGKIVVSKIIDDSPDPIRLGGIGEKLANQLEKLTDHEVRSVSLGHIQRGGDTSPHDRILSARYANATVDLISQRKFGNMVCLKNNKMSYVSLEKAVENQKFIKMDDELLNIARAMGISLGDA
ncbi:MAG: ATP-dependent 6-phosphofructokinase [Clostridiales bacterium]|jgi:6-phosphofructokinase 1|nr:ATP-dependent 6-phosphofructokinase [Clostridiales bacterium]